MPRVIRDKEQSRVAVFMALLKQRGLPHPHREFRFEPSRRWRADYCWPERGIILEVVATSSDKGKVA